ncbi:MAG: Fe-S cluster assembly protein SufD [Lentimicrobium sp.]|jgi:Fe-S cluster assembly protein SufD|nr:Fe-S cluster assembly protein SufD [Lentimicrobium sp.]MDD2529146.1 Fe-S cluster assembly protein SufD [Lentimicrobiaceae bacterium]MDD4599184.1 Fe-S cluster assembly protein SufD [Lentimicrobiaceae bacterium]MDY0026069.1 Fe-S cluster assembly protein SufD [Lentimicrobium sp.]
MDETNIQSNTAEKLQAFFKKNKGVLTSGDPPYLVQLRNQAFAQFNERGFPHTRLEKWRNTDLSRILDHDFHFPLKPSPLDVDLDEVFRCEVPDFNTRLIPQMNGWFMGSGEKLPNGVIISSMAEAIKKYPELIEKHFGHYADIKNENLTALNTAFFRDGVFIYVPDNIRMEQPVQMVDLVNSGRTIFIQVRNLIVLGKNSSMSLVQCDDSIDNNVGFNNTVTEVYMDENSTLDHYKLQNKNNESALTNSTYFHLEKGANLSTNAISLNGGLIRNETQVRLNGSNSHADVLGLYLMDHEQHIDNQVFIDHAVPHCTSNELFKGILDDHASGVFNGHILVRPDAQQTNAYQNNKNILISDKAVIDTKPFLEIYADDVKCSHGATVGQLDEDARFYLQSRGIGRDNAQMLLMYAFAADIVDKIAIPQLRNRIDDLVKKRLRGELSSCEQCVLHCNSKEQKVAFEIDMSRI